MKLKKIPIDFWLTLPIAILILYFAIANEQTVIKTLPTLITLVVQILLVRANRLGFLLGGCNSILYGLSYLSEGLYFSVISAVFISFPIQIYSYFNWKKAAADRRPAIRFLGLPRLAIALTLTLLGWGACMVLLAPQFKSAAYPAIDALLFVAGITVSLLAARQFADSQYMNIVSCAISLVLWIIISARDMSNFNYVIISFYNLFRISQAAYSWTKIYIRDKKASAEQGQNSL